MDASRYFFEQLSGRFFRVSLLLFTIFTILLAVLIVREHQVSLIATKELPLLIAENKRQHEILLTYLALDNLAKRENADQLANDFQKAQQQIKDIALLMPNKSKLAAIFVGHKEAAGVIDKLSKKHDRNNQLKQSTIIQLQLINDQLTIDINDKQQQKQLLSQQINSDKFKDKVTATRVKAYTKQISTLSELQQLQQAIIRALLAFQQLNLQYSIVEFDDVSVELKQALEKAFPEEGSIDNEVPLLTKQLITLEQLLFSQQNSVAKWRSHLRLTRLYIDFIKQQQQKLQQLVLDTGKAHVTHLDKNVLLIDLLPTNIKKLLAEQKVTLTNQHLQFASLSIMALLFLLLLVMIFKIKASIKNYGQESVEKLSQFIECKINDSEEKLTPEQLNSNENKLIAEKIQNALDLMIKPEHSESEYQQQLQEQQIASDKIKQQTQEIQELKNNIEQQAVANNKQNSQWQLQASAQNEKLTNMVVRTMLQSQNASIGSDGTSSKVYRQLARIFECCRQNKMRNELVSATQPKTLSDVAFHHEIDAALLNIITDAHFQRNKIYYQQDDQLLSQAKVDVDLFHQLFSGVCRLLLAELFNANLHIHCAVMDKNQGQQIVRFDFSITTRKKIGQVPEGVSRLVADDQEQLRPASTSDSVDYLCLLLDLLYATDRNLRLQEHGYQLSFTLPIAFADVEQTKGLHKVDLQQANILLLSDDDNIQLATQKAITAVHGSIDNTTQKTSAIAQLSVEQLTDNKIDMVILGSDLYAKSLADLEQHIKSLPHALQPKLLVMQPHFNAPLQRHGLFEQTANPLKTSQLQHSVSDLLATEHMSNIYLNANIFAEHQYLNTQVEVLFAVAEPAKHLTLIRILQWLGLQVKVVCQPTALLKLWGTGRYLILFSEFEQSPFIDMPAGKNVRRDIFTFKNSNLLIEEGTNLSENWLINEIPDIHELDQLVALLQPWLKVKQSNLAAESHVKNNVLVVPENIKTKVSKTNQQLDAVLSTIELGSNIEQLEAFNLEKYSQNQGSTELAIVMLDDYLADIDHTMQTLSVALEAQNYQQGVSLIESLLKMSAILAAQDFYNFSQDLLSDIKQNIEHQQTMIRFANLQQLQRQLHQFAEAI